MLGKFYIFGALLSCSVTKLRSTQRVCPPFLDMHGSFHLLVGVSFVTVWLLVS